ncbi:putative membrane protein [Streptomyces anthocyanicus]|uniref:MMPL family transporter n=1 Tax=Streptomyces anthocyanicus TaxID=68174 RepID=UPI001873D3C1|nr:MMPL family transporter [Streptomyces anthocyanicus]GHC09104.1 putative membrane protein [Streptomyces anthocyanicus]
MLSTLARAATRRPLTVMLLWGLFLLLGFGLGTGVFGRLSDDVPDVPGTESQVAAEHLDGLDPAGDSITGVVEAAAVTDPAVRAEVRRAVVDLREVAGVAEVPDPYATPGAAVDDAADRLHGIDGSAVSGVHVSGGPLLGQQLGERAQEDVKNAELISLPVVLVLLLVVFGGLRAAGLPLLVAVAGIAGAFLALFGFSHVTDISVYAIQVTTMLGLGLAVDYALLMLVRFREERRHIPDVVEAVHRTVAAAGRTVLFSGLTVAVSLAGLLVFPSTFLRSMGLAVAAVVVVDMLAALTLLPALLTRFGGRIPPAKARPEEEGRLFARLARFAARRRVAVLAVAVPALLVVALPVTGMSINLGDARQLPKSTEARQLYDAIEAHFPPGTGVSPVTVVLRPGTDTATADRIGAIAGGTTVRDLPGGTTVLELPAGGAADGPAATELVERVRDLRGDAPVQVTGSAAQLVDFRQMLADRAPWAALTVLTGIFVLLFAFTGSVLLPLRTVATTLLSLGAALGAVVWVFQDGHLAGPIGAEGLGALSLTAPPLIIAIAFGLAMDYELFILARMLVTGLRRSGRVVTCAALLLAVVFGAFMTGGFSPILQIGLGLTLAVLIDATVVRMLLVPATMALLGRHAWWAPKPLRRAHERFGVREEAPGPAPAPPQPAAR